MRNPARHATALALIICSLTRPAAAQSPANYVPPVSAISVAAPSELVDLVNRYNDDWQLLNRRFALPGSTERPVARAFLSTWLATLDSLSYDNLGVEGRIDWHLLQNEISHEQALLDRDAQRGQQLAPLLPFVAAINGLESARREFRFTPGDSAAAILSHIASMADSLRKSVDSGSLKPTRIDAYRAADLTASAGRTMTRWFRFSDGYDPVFSWWTRAPYAEADSALKAYAKVLREKVVGMKKGEDDPIVGQPIGRDGLMADLQAEMIPYTPEELIAEAERQMDWMTVEMKTASREMGFGDDWKAALEAVKQDHVAPGEQPELVRDLAREAVDYVESHDLVTVPPLARDAWRMTMLSAEAQKTAPFFLGGEVVQIAYPTDSMTEPDKLMSMRGNNRHFARATVFHELIPGHELQQFMGERYNAQRGLFGTPFFWEGNSFYWETLFWDMGFPKGPADRIGMLFWRMHRSARVIFSLNFHLGKWTPEQCIQFLVDRVGHERANAEAEVRRSFNGDYSPLYQVAYMMGGMQFRALHHELVDSHKMTDRAFHDAILQSGPIPVELVRARLEGIKLPRDWKPSWKFLGALPAGRSY
jgi:hypothetical protein